jgi:hypothetical protein
MIPENDINKKVWSNPELFILDFKETKGGNNPSDTEDLDLDAFNDLSP